MHEPLSNPFLREKNPFLGWGEGCDAWNGIWFSSFYFALAKMTYDIQTSKAPSLHKFPDILAAVEWAVTNSLFWGFLVALSAQLGEAKAENIQTADPAFIRDSWVSCSLWSCSAHSSDVAKQALGVLFTWNMTVFTSGKLSELLLAAGKSGGKLHLLKGCARGLISCSQGLRAIFKIFNNREQQGSTTKSERVSHQPTDHWIK